MNVRIFRPRPASPSRVTRLVREVFASLSPTPAPLAPLAPVVPLPPVGLYEADEMPAPEEIDQACAEFSRAADAARAAERTKRRSKKLIDRLASGVYGRWEVIREPSGRATVDLEAVRAHYKSLGLELPMKPSAPSLRVNRIAVDIPELADVEFETLAAVAR